MADERNRSYTVEFGVTYPWHEPAGEWWVKRDGQMRYVAASDVLALADAVAPSIAEEIREAIRAQAEKTRELAEAAVRGIAEAEQKATEADLRAARADRVARALAPEGFDGG